MSAHSKGLLTSKLVSAWENLPFPLLIDLEFSFWSVSSDVIPFAMSETKQHPSKHCKATWKAVSEHTNSMLFYCCLNGEGGFFFAKRADHGGAIAVMSSAITGIGSQIPMYSITDGKEMLPFLSTNTDVSGFLPCVYI